MVPEVMTVQRLGNTGSSERSCFRNSFLHRATSALAGMQKERRRFVSACGRLSNRVTLVTPALCHRAAVCTQQNAWTVRVLPTPVQRGRGFGLRVRGFPGVTQLLQ